jgi:hypothetical protein
MFWAGGYLSAMPMVIDSAFGLLFLERTCLRPDFYVQNADTCYCAMHIYAASRRIQMRGRHMVIMQRYQQRFVVVDKHVNSWMVRCEEHSIQVVFRHVH